MFDAESHLMLHEIGAETNDYFLFILTLISEKKGIEKYNNQQ